MTEIQEAIEKLPQPQKEALSSWLLSHEEISMSAQEEFDLLASLETAEKQLDSGQGVPLEQVRNMVRKWALK